MWIEICDSEAVVQGMLNLERLDVVKVGSAHGDNYCELIVKQGTVTKTYYVDGTDLNKLQHYLNESR